MNIENLPKQKVYLVDMDGVLAQYYNQFLKRWRQEYPDRDFIHEEDLQAHDLDKSYPEAYRDDINLIISAPDFFESLDPLPGAIEGIKELAKHNKVFICTAPSIHNTRCAHGKTKWVRKHLGKEWLRNLIITKDKTVVHGDFLIDDKPDIKGHLNPSWEHILYDQSYNRREDQSHKKRMTWKKGLFELEENEFIKQS
ncbi:MAG: 5'-3'-deoxyribonucleotidase [Nanoarchaeota archaeon]|nr:5'-3'-deoxyribonucleotidase [Nanoarchaeota archaeon]